MNVNLLIPGHGEETRVSNLVRTIDRISPQSCTVYTYRSTSFRHDACTIISFFQNMLWTMAMKDYIPKYAALDVLLVIDDVIVPPNDILSLYRPNAPVLSASIFNWHHKVMRPSSQRVWKKTSYVDILTVRFSPDAWKCWRKNINLEINTFGWGYDISFQRLCKFDMYIQNNCTVRHPPHAHGPTYKHRLGLMQLNSYMKFLNISRHEMASIIKNG